MTDETITDRGFVHWDPIEPIAGRGDGTDIVKFYESSGVAAIRGTMENPEIITGPFAWLRVGEIGAHLTRAEVGRLYDYMGRWLAQNPESDEEQQP